MNSSTMNVSNERGVKWLWSQMNGLKSIGTKSFGLKWMISNQLVSKVMNRRLVYNICFMTIDKGQLWCQSFRTRPLNIQQKGVCQDISVETLVASLIWSGMKFVIWLETSHMQGQNTTKKFKLSLHLISLIFPSAKSKRSFVLFHFSFARLNLLLIVLLLKR